MKLIEADVLAVLFEDSINHYTKELEIHKDIPQRYKNRIEGKIDGIIACGMDLITMPTVEAIPIEWIYENAGEYFSGLEVLHLYKMIEDWEKENETNRR